MKENRVHERIGCQMEFICSHYLDDQGERQAFVDPIEFEVLNMSAGGLMVRSKRDLPLQSVLCYTFYLEYIPHMTMSRVIWKESTAKGILYGLEFLVISNMFYRHLKDYTLRGGIITCP